MLKCRPANTLSILCSNSSSHSFWLMDALLPRKALHWGFDLGKGLKRARHILLPVICCAVYWGRYYWWNQLTWHLGGPGHCDRCSHRCDVRGQTDTWCHSDKHPSWYSGRFLWMIAPWGVGVAGLPCLTPFLLWLFEGCNHKHAAVQCWGVGQVSSMWSRVLPATDDILHQTGEPTARCSMQPVSLSYQRTTGTWWCQSHYCP